LRAGSEIVALPYLLIKANSLRVAIHFHTEDIRFDLKQKRRTKQWLKQISERYSHHIDTLQFIFCSDEYLLDINQRYLNHDYYTDIITFPYQSNPIQSDIFISIDRVKDNASQLKLPFENELRRVLAHGLLHLCGLDDKTEESKNAMRKEEDLALMQWFAATDTK